MEAVLRSTPLEKSRYTNRLDPLRRVSRQTAEVKLVQRAMSTYSERGSLPFHRPQPGSPLSKRACHERHLRRMERSFLTDSPALAVPPPPHQASDTSSAPSSLASQQFTMAISGSQVTHLVTLSPASQLDAVAYSVPAVQSIPEGHRGNPTAFFQMLANTSSFRRDCHLAVGVSFHTRPKRHTYSLVRS